MDLTALADVLPASTGDPVTDTIQNAQFFDNFMVPVPLAESPNVETISRDETHHHFRYETGAIWLEKYKPCYFREGLSYPINSPRDAFSYTMIDPDDPVRVAAREKAKPMIREFHEAGYFVQASVMGAWVGIYIYLASLENILTWMAAEPDAAHALFDMTRTYSLASARRLLTCGVDCIETVSDLGHARGLLFSPAMFREYVFPWLKELATLCHEHGIYLYFHSHGHIEEVMDGIVEAGVDIINPIGPSDYNDLAMFKRRWGDRITIDGGLSNRLATMSEEEIRDHVKSVIAVGRKGGRFFPRTESGIPPMPRDKVLFFLDVLKEERSHGYE